MFFDFLNGINYIFKIKEFLNFQSYFLAPFITSLILSLALGFLFIKYFKTFTSSLVRQHTPETHIKKNYTPTMGGVFIILSSFFTNIIFFNFKFLSVCIIFLCLIGYAIIGFIDDFSKIKKTGGMSANFKFLLQLIIGFLILSLWLFFINSDLNVFLPILNLNIKLGIFYILWASFIMIGSSNAVNLTDGLDGLAISSLIINYFLFFLLIFISTFYQNLNIISSSNLNLMPIMFFISSIIGSSLGFLFYNRYPAKIFMGDAGSLSLGATLGFISLILKMEFFLAISGMIFIIETLSVIIQIFWFKKFKKRIFLMAPIHHHFELLKWQETKIVNYFSLFTIVFSMIALTIFIVFSC